MSDKETLTAALLDLKTYTEPKDPEAAKELVKGCIERVEVFSDRDRDLLSHVATRRQAGRLAKHGNHLPEGYERLRSLRQLSFREQYGGTLPSRFRRQMAQWIFARLPPAGWPHPLGTEHISPRPLGTLGHRYLPPGLLRQFSAALRQAAPLPAPQPGLAGTPESLVCRAGPLGI